MRRSLFIIGLALLVLALPCGAQSLRCGVVGAQMIVLGGSPFIGFTPPSPSASQTVTITVGMDDYIPAGATAVVQGNAINVTFSGNFLGFDPPATLTCSTVSVGPLPASSYAINMFLAGQSTNLVATSALTVALAATSLPTTSRSTAAVLALLLVASGWFFLRRADDRSG